MISSCQAEHSAACSDTRAAHDAPLHCAHQAASCPAQDAGELYSYTIGDSGAPRTFRSAPRRGSDTEFSFIVYGDMGESEHRAARSPGCARPCPVIYLQHTHSTGLDRVK